MAAAINEGTQYVDIDGKPIVNGSLFIGLKGADPEASPISIFSDRELTVSLANPQTLDSFGRSTNKIWIPAQYSIKVNNSNDVQKFIDLDAGEAAESGITSLTNVQGTNTITADGTPAISALIDKQTYVFTSANAVTGAATLQIDATDAKSIKKQHDQDLQAGDIEALQVVQVIYNSVGDVFELQAPSANTLTVFQKGADIASAAALVLGADGNYFDVTGAITITSIGSVVAVGIGNLIKLHFDSNPTLTHNATDIVLPGGVNIVTAAGDEAEFFEYATGDYRLTNYIRADGNNVIDIAEISNHARSANTQIRIKGTGGPESITSNVTETVWESYGATGSGADNIWTELNVLPAEATMLLVDASIFVDANALGDSAGLMFAHGDEGTPNLNFITEIINLAGPGVSEQQFTAHNIMIPINSTNQLFQVNWSATLVTSAVITMTYRGFMTDR